MKKQLIPANGKRHATSAIRQATAALALLCATAALAEKVEIRSAADWDNFASRVNNGEASLGAVLVRDVTLTPSSPRCGSSRSRFYRGDFDGNGKTLAVDWTLTYAGDGNPAAPFANIGYGCNVHDLHVVGNIKTDGKFAGGIFGWVQTSAVYLSRCRSSVTITCDRNGDATSAGLVACQNENTSAILTDCLFDGSLLGPRADSCGGLVGWRYNSAYSSVKNCLFAPNDITLSPANSFTLVRNGFKYSSNLSNGLYTRTFGTVQGTDASGMSAAQRVAALGNNWAVVDGAAVPTAIVSFVDEVRDPSIGTASFAYQGALRDAQGQPLSQLTHTVAFRIYDQPTGGSPHWGRTFNVTLDNEGLFNVRLGDESGEAIEGINGEDLAGVIAANANASLYVGLTVDGEDAEIMPRQKLLAVPYAVWAAGTATASGDMAVAGATSTVRMNVNDAISARSATVENKVDTDTLAISGRAEIGGDMAVSGAVSGAGTIPIGGIVIWSGSVASIPDGWVLCDGLTHNGRKTPDLRGRFVPGAGGDYSVGKTGGEATHKLTVNEMPSHNHTYDFKGADLDLAWKDSNKFYDASGHYSHGNTGYTASTGGDKAHENRPPYYALCYIMRVR